MSPAPGADKGSDKAGVWALFAWLDPLAFARGAWLRSRQGLGRALDAPGPNARFFILSCVLWTIPLALTNAYKTQYLSALGLSKLAIGGFFAIDMGARVLGVLLGAGLASPVAESLIKVGERSGALADMLERTARFQDEDFSRWVDWASRLLEPVLMAVLGLVIGTVVVLMYMPIFELAGSL